MGPLEDEGGLIYLRPETAQGIYVNFKNVLPDRPGEGSFGIAQVGKAFRNLKSREELHLPHLRVQQMEISSLSSFGRREVVRAPGNRRGSSITSTWEYGRASCASISTVPTSCALRQAGFRIQL